MKGPTYLLESKIHKERMDWILISPLYIRLKLLSYNLNFLHLHYKDTI